MGGRTAQGVDAAADQMQLAVADHHIAVGELHLAGADRLDLPALQHDAGLEAFLDVVLESGAAVLGDRGHGRARVGIALRHHAAKQAGRRRCRGQGTA